MCPFLREPEAFEALALIQLVYEQKVTIEQIVDEIRACIIKGSFAPDS